MADLSQQIADLRSLVLRQQAPEVMTPAEAAEFLSVTVESLFRWRKDATGPKYSRVNDRVIRYLRDDLIDWIREHR
ncbi:helix-turn-helix transcriptional regulator [Tabrizicola fusiformis]|uniref:helix-turn-helix transcriptional regulator n=1 Tax=Tabrizicola sp. SY72 TaxID=2741673 RepID=UPI0019D55253|nr:helix-turn-helix domain-containing protein [Tabrizicola sp. SY72]